VVNISVITRSPLEDNPLFRDPVLPAFFHLPDERNLRRQAAGSGVIVGRGARLRAHQPPRHQGRRAGVITLKDRRQFQAKLVGTDPGTDIAVLQIPAQNLTALHYGDSDQLQVGDYVIAIGNPFGIGQT